MHRKLELMKRRSFRPFKTKPDGQSCIEGIASVTEVGFGSDGVAAGEEETKFSVTTTETLQRVILMYGAFKINMNVCIKFLINHFPFHSIFLLL